MGRYKMAKHSNMAAAYSQYLNLLLLEGLLHESIEGSSCEGEVWEEGGREGRNEAGREGERSAGEKE